MSSTLNILSGGAAQGLLAALSREIEAATGCTVAATFGAVGAIRDQLIAGAPADLVILTRAVIDELERCGHVAPGTALDLGVVHTGIAVRAGDPLPDIGTAVALRAALRAADAIYFPDPTLATAGIHFAKVQHLLGVADELGGRLETFPNGAAAMHAMAGRRGGTLIGCTQITEIIATAGTALVGPLPHEFELATVYTMAVASRAAAPDQARWLSALLAGPETAGARARSGMAAGH